MFRKFSHWFDTPHGGKSSPDKLMKGRPCAQEGCVDEGIYRAPKSRYHLEAGVDDWYWFCLIHIRDYNARWNYYKNMSEEEIEKERRADVTWQRPSWPLGSQGYVNNTHRAPSGASFEDPFDLLGDDPSSSKFGSELRFSPLSVEGKALAFFGLSIPFSQDELRKRYLDLVKKHHPDANSGSSESEEMLKGINEAYEVLKRVF